MAKFPAVKVCCKGKYTVPQRIRPMVRDAMKNLTEEHLLPEGFEICDLDMVSEADEPLDAARRFKKRWKKSGVHTVDIGSIRVGDIKALKSGKDPFLLMAYCGRKRSLSELQKMSGWITGDL